MHAEPSPYAGHHLRISSGALSGFTFHVEDWWDRVAGKSWKFCDGNPACIDYALRERTPLDDEVLYGKIGGLGKLVHISQLEIQP